MPILNTGLKSKVDSSHLWQFHKMLCCTSTSRQVSCTPRRNAFDIMMAAQRERMSRVLPDKIVVRNKKDQLFNDMLMMIDKNGLKWKPSEVDSGTASNAFSSLCDALWYVDEHHQKIA